MAKRKPEIKFTNWAQFTLDARSFIPSALDYEDEAPWTQRALADLLGVDPNYVAIIERGEKEPGKQYQLMLGYLITMARNGIDPRAK